ncbi:DUF4148 domain-containing protein [Caballeronia sp. LP006]|uniref:DUF4148 domain-containing protein n=1 Tax=Caballeronia sp. LP006 TaxID=3038552 RepID=UPI0028622322|nr:DUF4148 domain-containing protein [Caballeronia sp. LP006]MDR5832321.1 DUF4148 domain-containing protein [Caballeronia sp. LP006]
MRATLGTMILSGFLMACGSPPAATVFAAQTSPQQCKDLTALGQDENPTRARVKSELAALTNVGYDSVADADTYPDSFQMAQQRVSRQYKRIFHM